MFNRNQFVLTGQRRDLGIPGMDSKYHTLPSISGSSELVPYGGAAADDAGGDERLRVLETRLNVTEKSNRALLDEVVRLQNELKSVARRNDETLREERKARQYLENSMRDSNDLVSQMSQRLRTAEERLLEERAALSGLVNQAKAVEERLMASVHGDQSARSTDKSKIAQLEGEVDEMSRGRMRLERVAAQTMEEVRGLKARLETQGTEVNSALTALQTKTRQLEQEYYNNLEKLRRLDQAPATNRNPGHEALRQQIEGRLAELRDIVVDVRGRHDVEATDRRSMEQRLTDRLNELSMGVLEQGRKREQTFVELEAKVVQRGQMTESERHTMLQKIDRLMEETNSKLADREKVLREEHNRKFSELDRQIQAENDARREAEQTQKNELQRKMEDGKRMLDDEIRGVTEQGKMDKKKFADALKKLDDSVTLLEKQLEDKKRETDRVMSAEIKSRKNKDKVVQERLTEIEEKIAAATATLQQAIAGVSARMTDSNEEEQRKILDKLLREQKLEVERLVNDLDLRLTSLAGRMNETDAKLETRISASNQATKNNLREKMEQVSDWQRNIDDKVSKLKTEDIRLQQENEAAHEKLALVKSEAQSLVKIEEDKRKEEMDYIRAEIDKLRNIQPKKSATTPPPKQPDLEEKSVAKYDDRELKSRIDECQASIRKLAESMQTVKTVLGMKIQAEQKLRVEEVKTLQDELVKLRALIEPLIKYTPRVFVKPEDVDNEIVDQQDKDTFEQATPAVNRWSVYTVFRWLKYREMLKKWKELAEEAEPDDEDEDEEEEEADVEEDEEDEDEDEDDEEDEEPPKKDAKKPPPPADDDDDDDDEDDEDEDDDDEPPPAKPAAKPPKK